MSEVRRFVPRGIAAIDPQALGVDFPCSPPPANRRIGNLAIVGAAGPLSHDGSSPFDSYSAIGERFSAAIVGQPAAVILSVNSPGGDVAGSFDLARPCAGKRRRLASL